MIEIYIGQDQLELFETENISITSSVLDIQDITKNTTDYSKSFTVPASEINNKIFKHYYEYNIDNGFDARVSVSGRIEIGGVPFRQGEFLLQKVNLKGLVPASYTINFWGSLVSLKDVLGNDKLSDLDLSFYDHEYTGANVKSLLENSAPIPAYLYTLLAKKRYYYNSDLGDITMSDTVANIHYRSGTSNGVKYSDLQASLNLYVIKVAIEVKYGVTFSDDFFGRDEFKRLYLWLNNSDSKKPGGQTKKVNFTGGDTTYISTSTDIGTYYTKGIPYSGTSESFALFIRVTPDSGFTDVDYTINFYSDTYVLQGSVTGSGVQFLAGALTAKDKTDLEYTYSSRWELVTTDDFDYTVECLQTKYIGATPQPIVTTTGADSLGSVFEIKENIPDIKIIDFLKGLFNAFKLVVIPQQDGTIYVNTVNSFYAEGERIDITNYVDIENADVARGEILNDISYKFEDPTTILNEQFKENTGIAYGDEEAQLRDESGNLLEGGSHEVVLPFEQIIYERLYDENNKDTIELMVGQVTDKNNNPVNPKPHIFYRQSYVVSGDGIGFIDENDVKTSIKGRINTSSHVIDDVNPSHSFIFSEEFNNFNGALISNTLYLNYHQTYINSLFNIKRRNYVYRTKILPESILLRLTLNDVLKIGLEYYRIDKFTTNLTTGETEFNLVNFLENDLTGFVSDNTYIVLTSPAQSYQSYVSNLTTYTENKIDLGHGTSWVTVSKSGSYIVFTVTQNITSYRDVQVNITDDVSGTVIQFYIGQYSGLIGADSSDYTADSTTLTADNDKNFL